MVQGAEVFVRCDHTPGRLFLSWFRSLLPYLSEISLSLGGIWKLYIYPVRKDEHNEHGQFHKAVWLYQLKC